MVTGLARALPICLCGMVTGSAGALPIFLCGTETGSAGVLGKGGKRPAAVPELNPDVTGSHLGLPARSQDHLRQVIYHTSLHGSTLLLGIHVIRMTV